MPGDFAQEGDIFIFLEDGPPLLFLGINDRYPDCPENLKLMDRYHVVYWDLRNKEKVDLTFKNYEFSILRETKMIRNGEEVDLSRFFSE